MVIILFAFSHKAKAQGNFTVLSDSILTANPRSCDSLRINVITYSGCINSVYNGTTVTKNGGTINVDISYSLGPICFGAITYPTYTVNLGLLPAGSYNIVFSAYLNSNKVNSINDSINVNGCCPSGSNLTADFSLSDTVVCFGDSIKFTNNSMNYDSTTWVVDGQFYSSDTNIIYSSSSAGIHTVELITDSGFCSKSILKSFEIVSPPTANLGSDTTICTGDTLLLSVNDSNSTYLWQDSSTLDHFTVDTTGTYWVEVTNAAGCISRDTVDVKVSICVSVDKNKKENNQIISYPNPTNAKISLKINNGEYGHYVYQLRDIRGRIVKSGTLNLTNNPTQFDLSAFPSGIYMLQMQKGDIRINKKVTKN